MNLPTLLCEVSRLAPLDASKKGKERGQLRERARERVDRDQEKATMATLSDLKEVKEALDAGLVSQAEFDDVKRDYLRVKKEALEAKEEAFEVEK